MKIRETLIALGARQCDWMGYEGWEHRLGECSLHVVLPREMAPGAPWFWRPEFFGAFADTDCMLLERGWVLVFLNLPDHYGCPRAVEKFAEMHHFATGPLSLAPKVAVVALSRAGLSAYNFASAHPDKVCAIYADNPVCDFRSWPGGLGVGPGSSRDWAKLLKVYGFNDSAARAYERQPIAESVLQTIVDADIPVFHVCGDADEVVPFEENTVLLRETFKALGGRYQEILQPGGKHHPHGLPDPTPVVKFLESAFGGGTDSERTRNEASALPRSEHERTL